MSQAEPMIDPSLLELLRCPDCRSRLMPPDPEPTSLTCAGCGLVYPVRDRIPVLLVDEATRPSQQG